MSNQNIYYNGNTNIKKAGIPQQYTKEEIEEYVKCSQDVLYFIENYATIVTLDHGKQKFKLRDYQKRMIETYNDNRFCITVTSRQIGKCALDSTVISICEKPERGIKKILHEVYSYVRRKIGKKSIKFNQQSIQL